MKDVTVTLPDCPVPTLTFRLDPESVVQSAMLEDLRGAGYEPATWNTIRETLRPGDRAVDVGAHVGVLTCLMAASVGPTGYVDAFEPDPVNRARLAYHVIENGLASWVTIHPNAVGESMRTVTFYRCAYNDGGHARWNPAQLPANVESQRCPSASAVQMVSLDDAVSGPVRLIKSDTEGGELGVFRGAKRLLAAHPVIIAEIHRFGLQQLGGSEGELRAFLRDYGYVEAVLDTDGRVIPVTPADTVMGPNVFNLRFT